MPYVRLVQQTKTLMVVCDEQQQKYNSLIVVRYEQQQQLMYNTSIVAVRRWKYISCCLIYFAFCRPHIDIAVGAMVSFCMIIIPSVQCNKQHINSCSSFFLYLDLKIG